MVLYLVFVYMSTANLTVFLTLLWLSCGYLEDYTSFTISPDFRMTVNDLSGCTACLSAILLLLLLLGKITLLFWAFPLRLSHLQNVSKLYIPIFLWPSPLHQIVYPICYAVIITNVHNIMCTIWPLMTVHFQF